MCEGCWRRCEYQHFRDSLPVDKPDRSKGYTRLGDGGRRDFIDVATDRAIEVTGNIGRGVGDRLTKAKILGQMHEEKQAEWDKATTECYYQGQRLPRTMEDALRWVASMGDERFRKEVQGWSHDRWGRTRRSKRIVTTRTFLRWWDEVRQMDMFDADERPNLEAPGESQGRIDWDGAF